MPALPTQCPACQAPLFASRLACLSCQTQLEGAFDIPQLLRLAPDDLDFVIRFVLASGSLKEMAKAYKLSYPTIRNRLNAVIEKLQRAGGADAPDDERLRILDELAKGTLSVAAAERRLKALS